MDIFIKTMLEEEQRAFAGWDFSHLEGRWESEKLPWDYREIVLEHLKKEHTLLDMGTGGGEFLLTLDHPYENTYVTEGWEPNVALCKKKLAPLGIRVEQVSEDLLLPFEDRVFDIVINRHESYSVSEVKRILKMGGLFITQQVGGRNNVELSQSIIEHYRPETLDFALKPEAEKFEDEGFKVLLGNEHFPTLKFYDIGAFVYFAKIIEWEFPGFSVQSHSDKLRAMDNEIKQKGYLSSLEHRFMLVAERC